MKVLVIGSGGREHAIAWKISQSRLLKRLYCAPGNPGTAQLGQNIEISPKNVDQLLDWAKEQQIDLTVVGPEAPLVEGIADRFRAQELKIVGPDRLAARLEGSKVFAKHFMRRHRIPTAGYQIFDHPTQALEAIDGGRFDFPLVVKADGLAAGKGVFICRDRPEAAHAVDLIMVQQRFGEAGNRVVLEEFLRGEEASFMVLTDGRKVLPLVASQDHKAIFEEDRGPNTGGMGAYSCDAILSPPMQSLILDRVIHPALKGIRTEGGSFRGVLYAGLMLTASGPRVLEFNVRLGDPETQAVLPRLESDLLEAFLGSAGGDLSTVRLNWSSRPTVTVVLASEGYPGRYVQGREISGPGLAAESAHTQVFHAGTRLQGNQLVTAGGRVLAVTSHAPTLAGAIRRAYQGVEKVHFKGMYYRRDIAAKGLSKSGG